MCLSPARVWGRIRGCGGLGEALPSPPSPCPSPLMLGLRAKGVAEVLGLLVSILKPAVLLLLIELFPTPPLCLQQVSV